AHTAGGLWYGPMIVGRGSQGTVAAPTTSGSAQLLLRLQGDANYNGNFEEAAQIEFLTDDTPNFLSYPGRIVFKTTSSGGTASQEHMRIDADGNVGIGTDAAETKMHVKGGTADGVYASTVEVTHQHGEF